MDVPPAEGAIGSTCPLHARIEASASDDGRDLELRFSLVNADARAKTVTLHVRCPQGLVSLHGLPRGFDPMHTCRMGACIEPESTRVLRVPGHGAVALGETLLRGDGDSCNPPLPEGPIVLTATVNGSSPPALVCGSPAVTVDRAAETGALRVQAQAPERAAPTPAPGHGPAEKPARVRPRPERDHPCPVCSIGCPNGVPLTGTGPDGCPRCGCTNLQDLIRAPPPDGG